MDSFSYLLKELIKNNLKLTNNEEKSFKSLQKNLYLIIFSSCKEDLVHNSLTDLEKLLWYSHTLRRKRKFDDANKLDHHFNTLKNRGLLAENSDVRNVLRFVTCLIDQNINEETKLSVPSPWIVSSKSDSAKTLPSGPLCFNDTRHDSAFTRWHYTHYPPHLFSFDDAVFRRGNEDSSWDMPDLRACESEPGTGQGFDFFKKDETKIPSGCFGALVGPRRQRGPLALDTKFRIPDLPPEPHGYSCFHLRYSEEVVGSVYTDSRKDKELTPVDEGYVSSRCSMVEGLSPRKLDDDDWESVMRDGSLAPRRTWEGLLGQNGGSTPVEKSFISEAGPSATQWLWWIQQDLLNIIDPSVKVPAYNEVPTADLCSDVINLLLGIQSTNFPLSQDNSCFGIREGLCYAGVTPDALRMPLQELIECANNVLRLNEFCSCSGKDRPSVPLAVKAFKSSVDEFLSYYRQKILLLEDEVKFLSLKLKSEPLRQKIDFVSTICLRGIEEHFISSLALIGELYETLMRTRNSSNQYLLLSFINAACRPFLISLEKWIYEGEFFDPESEFMIEANPAGIRTRNSLYWTAGYSVLDRVLNVVPDFLKDLLVSAFECGKAVNLLKLCCPKSFLFSNDDSTHPPVKLCVSLNEVYSTRIQCFTYATKMEILSQSLQVTLKDFEEKESERDENLVKIATFRHLQFLQSFQEKKKEKAEREFEKKEKTFEALREDLEDRERWREKGRVREEAETLLLQKREEELEAEELKRQAALFSEYETEASRLSHQVALQKEKLSEVKNYISSKRYGKSEEQNVKNDINEDKIIITDEKDTENKTELGGLDLRNIDKFYKTESINMDKVDKTELGLRNIDEFDKTESRNVDKFYQTESINVNKFDATELGLRNIDKFDKTESRNVDKFYQTESINVNKFDTTELGLRNIDKFDKTESRNVDKFDKTEFRNTNFDKTDYRNVDKFDDVDENVSQMSLTSDVTATPVDEIGDDIFETFANIANVRTDPNSNWEMISEENEEIDTGNEVLESKNECPDNGNGLTGAKNEVPGKKNVVPVNKNEFPDSEKEFPDDKNEFPVNKNEFPDNKNKLPIQIIENEEPEVENKVLQKKNKMPATENELPVPVLQNKNEVPVSGTLEINNRYMISDSNSNKVTPIHPTLPKLDDDKNLETHEPDSSEIAMIEMERGPENAEKVMKRGPEIAKKPLETGPESDPVIDKEPESLDNSIGRKPDPNSGNPEVVFRIPKSKSESVSLKDSGTGTSGGSIPKRMSMFDFQDTETPILIDQIIEKKTTGSEEVESSSLFGTKYFEDLAAASISKVLPYSICRLQDMKTVTDVTYKFRRKMKGSARPEGAERGSVPPRSQVCFAPIYFERGIAEHLQVQSRLANCALLSHFLVQKQLLKHLEAIKGFVLMQDAGFAKALTQNLVRKFHPGCPAYPVTVPVELNGILSEALTASSSARSPMASNLSFVVTNTKITPSSLFEWIQLRYSVAWPLNIVLDDKIMASYGRISKFLSQLHCIMWTIEDIFRHMAVIQSSNPGSSRGGQFHVVSIFRHEVQQFVRVLSGYVCHQAIEGSWWPFQNRVREKVKTLDQLYQCHARFLSDVIDKCFLSPSAAPIQNLIQDLFSEVFLFQNLLNNYGWRVNVSTELLEWAGYTSAVDLMSRFREVSATFNKSLQKLFEYSHLNHVEDLVTHLNYNESFSQEKSTSVF